MKQHAAAGRLIDWYRKNRILYPWRETKDPYRVWLSEILLQQTRIPIALGFYRKILALYPTLQTLADSDPEKFVSSWSGIGYYARARNMVHCAKKVATVHNGAFPSDLESLLQLPGIGPYTAGALRNICFDFLTPAIDGNIRRVLSRIAGNKNKVGSKRFRDEIETDFLRFGRGTLAGDYFQALMELGEQICLPTPVCSACPVSRDCYAFENRMVLKLPLSNQKKKQETFHWYFLVLSRKDAKTFYALNPQRPFLKQAWIFPDVLSKEPMPSSALRKAYKVIWGIEWKSLQSTRKVNHTVTFRKISGHVLHTEKHRVRNRNGKWLSPQELANYPTSSIVHKILKGMQGSLSRKSK